MSEYVPKKRRTLADTLQETPPVPTEVMRSASENIGRIASGALKSVAVPMAPAGYVHTAQTVRSLSEQTRSTEQTEQTEQTSVKVGLLQFAQSRIVLIKYILMNRSRLDRQYATWSGIARDTGLSLISVRRSIAELPKRGIIRCEFDALTRKGTKI